jgi:hypothetical protein
MSAPVSPAERTPFDYLLNAFEQASQSDSPATAGYFEKRRALLEHVRKVEAALDEVATLRAELELFRTAGIIEVAVRNPNVSSYMDHWEGRTLKAESELATLRARLTQMEADYYELLYQVASKFPGETRHQTALRYIRTHEDHCGKGGPSRAALAPEGT